MFGNLWKVIRQFLGVDGGWELATLSRVAVDPASARALTRVLQPAHTIRLRPEPVEVPHTVEPGILWHGITDPGMVRDHNEDSFSLVDLGTAALFLVADGMGGHDAGEVASRVAVDAAESAVRSGWNGGNGSDDAGLSALVTDAVQEANTAVRKEAARRSSNMGTTLTVALVHEQTAYIASVGDSRAYWIANGSILQVTKDHSLVAKLVEQGRLTKEDARTDRRSNLLLRNIGSEVSVAVDTYRLPLSGSGTLLLCTDGLWGEVGDEEILRVCSEEQHTEVVCARLVQLANANGGRDNITAIAVKVS